MMMMIILILHLPRNKLLSGVEWGSHGIPALALCSGHGAINQAPLATAVGIVLCVRHSDSK